VAAERGEQRPGLVQVADEDFLTSVAVAAGAGQLGVKLSNLTSGAANKSSAG
jgi:hypothetical protein